MPILAIIIGAALTVLAIIGYIATGMVSWTALIPAFFGAPIILLGTAAMKPRWRKHAMHAAAAIALLGLLGSARGVPSAVRALSGAEIDRPGAAISQAIMAVLCLVFVIMAVKSFIDARRCRNQPVEAQETAAGG